MIFFLYILYYEFFYTCILVVKLATGPIKEFVLENISSETRQMRNVHKKEVGI